MASLNRAWKYDSPSDQSSTGVAAVPVPRRKAKCIACARFCGTLVELMPEYRASNWGGYAVYPTRKHVAAKVRALIDFLGERFGEVGRFG